MQKKIYNIADNLEIWKQMSITQGVKIDIESLGRNIKITQIENADGLPFNGQGNHVYIMTYNAENEKESWIDIFLI